MLTANPVLSGKPPPVEGDSGMAFRLSHFFPALPSCSSLTQLAFSTGFKTRARKPDSHPKQSFRWGCSLRLSLNLSPFSTPGLYTGNWNAKQGVCEWREATQHLGSCFKCPSRPSPQCEAEQQWGFLLPAAQHPKVIHSNPLSYFRNDHV